MRRIILLFIYTIVQDRVVYADFRYLGWVGVQNELDLLRSPVKLTEKDPILEGGWEDKGEL